MKTLPLLVFIFTSAVQPGWTAEPPAQAADVRNFGQVNDHLFRGAAPSPIALQELGAMGVKLVIDLRETGVASKEEQAQADKLGMRYVNIPLPPTSAPTQDEIAHVLTLISQNETTRIFVHCRRGKDRTGTV